MRHIPARPEQTQSTPSLIRDTLRAAALAPSDREALDVLGAVFLDLVEAAREAEGVFARAGWREGDTFNPEAAAMTKLRAALGISKEVRHG